MGRKIPTEVPDASIARQPQQLRARERFDLTLDEAEVLLREEGLSGFSIPVLAERLGYTRASIYKFFPTPYAVLNELVRRKLAQLQQRLLRRAALDLNQPWRETMRAIVLEAVAYYNEDPVARLLLLGGPVSDDSYRAEELMIQGLGEFTRQLLAPRGIVLPEEPDVATLLMEIGTTCLRLSQFLHGDITPRYAEEAVRAMDAYLTLYAGEAEQVLPRVVAVRKGRAA